MDNKNKFNDKEYVNLVQDIIEHDKFNMTKEIVHHGLNRFDHCVRVSYYSYKVTKLLKLDYEKSARAGLLHDFFFVNNNGIGATRRLDVLINHPKYALINSKKYFSLSTKEEDIISSHMFPVALRTPKYIESWIVDIVDNIVAVGETVYSAKIYLGTAINFFVLILLNYWR